MTAKNSLLEIAESIATPLLFATIGVVIGVAKLMNSDESPPIRVMIGRALSTAGLAMAAGVVLVWVPELPLVGQIGVAALFASLGTTGLEKLFSPTLSNVAGKLGAKLGGAEDE